MQIKRLRIEIDEVKRARQVEEITETDYFRELKAQARQLRERSDPSPQGQEGERE